MAWSADDKSRREILFDAWQLALLGHPKLRQGVGDPQLELPGRRVEAITAVERRLAKTPDDPGAQEMRALLYGTLREDEYVAAAADGPVKDFGYAYAEGLGMSQIDDPERWQRGAFFLRVAGHGLPEKGPAIYDKLALAYEQRGDHEAARRYREKLRDVVLAVGGPGALPAEQKQIYFNTVKRLADDAMKRQDWDEAITNHSFYTQFDGSGIETLRSLAEAYEKKRDIRNALRVTEKGLVYDKRDEDMRNRKDKYYYSLEPDDLKKSADEMRGYFDIAYCYRKAKENLDRRDTSLDVVDWAQHLATLALVMQPKNVVATVQLARCYLRRGEREQALKLLEDVFHDMTPSGGEEKDAWFFAAKQLGKLYLDELSRPDLAIPCFLKYQESLNSGAETLFDLARAYEAVGDKARAIQYYKMVASYEENPLRWDAEEAIRRLKGEA
jgi:tetratricopeptide (TPR) repeat protein